MYVNGTFSNSTFSGQFTRPTVYSHLGKPLLILLNCMIKLIFVHTKPIFVCTILADFCVRAAIGLLIYGKAMPVLEMNALIKKYKISRPVELMVRLKLDRSKIQKETGFNLQTLKGALEQLTIDEYIIWDPSISKGKS